MVGRPFYFQRTEWPGRMGFGAMLRRIGGAGLAFLFGLLLDGCADDDENATPAVTIWSEEPSPVRSNGRDLDGPARPDLILTLE